MTLRAPDWPRCARCTKLAHPDHRVTHEGKVYCCGDCVPLGALELAQSTLRRQVLERDKGVCSFEGCRRDCLALRAQLDAMRAVALEDAPDRPSRARDLYQALVHGLVREGFPRSEVEGTRALWDCDHVDPTVRGGPSTLSNARTLCRAHHLQVTAELASERAGLRRPRRDFR